ncbi:MAG: sulfur carrier protein ThiS [Candidatus Abyssubacteria bacterium]
MRITLNGEPFETIEHITVAELLNTLGVDGARVAVELNLDILPKGEYANTALKEGDRLEVVHFVGGGKPQLEVSQ